MDDKGLSELRSYFDNATLPKEIKLDEGIVITDIPKFINSHFLVITSGNKMQEEIFLPRLLKLKELLSKS
jgi:uncharacterized protein DUF6965